MQKKNTPINVYLLAESYPSKLSAEYSFLNKEIACFADSNEVNLTLIPTSSPQSLHDSVYLPKNVKVDFSLAEFNHLSFGDKIAIPINFFFSLYFLRLIKKYGIKILNYHSCKTFAINLEIERRSQSFFQKFISENKLDMTNSIFYTFWFSPSTNGILNLKKERFNNLKIISRAHGSDLYNERGIKPFRDNYIHFIDGVFCISTHGHNYMSDLYPQVKKIFHVSKIGINNKINSNIKSTDNNIRIVSCAYVIPLKRVEKIFHSIYLFTEKNKVHVEWIHFGGGSHEASLKDYISTFKKNEYMTIDLKGSVQNDEVIEYYHKNPVDLFINLSTTEGLPVSMMEAQSNYIPILATNVGGVSEIVNFTNGYLVPADFSFDDVIKGLESILFAKDIDMYRLNAFNSWRQNHNGDVVYPNFIDAIRKLLYR